MATMTASQLLKADEKEFDASIKEMSLQNLLNTISVLQKEMSREQQSFNSLSGELSGLKKNSSQYKSINKDMAKSQTRLTVLMNRSMKCFAQQGNQQAKATVARKNSLKETQRSEVRNRNSLELESKQVIKDTQAIKSGSSTQQTDEPQGETVKSSFSFSEAMSKFGGKPQNSNHVTNKSSVVIVSSANSLSQNGSESTRPASNNIGNKDNSNSNTGDKHSAKSSAVSVNSKPTTHSTSVAKQSKQSLGPLANQNGQYLSKSMDTALNTKSAESAKAAPDVVHSSQAGKQRSVLVMNADKQVIDLDSFTDRKNMLAELKSGKKGLKPTATKVKVDRNSENTNDEPTSDASENHVSSESNEFPRGNLLGEIRKGKQLSEIKDNKAAENGVVTEDKQTIVKENVNMSASQQQFKAVEKDFVKKVEVLKVDAKLPASAEILNTVGTEESEESDTSEASENDDTFVTEFQFPGISMQQPATKSTGKIYILILSIQSNLY